MPRKFDTPHPYSGRLIIVEGIDGSGKSTQLKLLSKWLENRGHNVFITEWNSSALVRETIRLGKKKNLLTPTTFSILHATDFADRLAHSIMAPLKAGMIVLADRYIYTAFSRDVVRGVHPEWVRDLYGFAIRPDVALYFRVPVDVALGRIMSGRRTIKYYEAGMDLHLSATLKEGFHFFQGRVLGEYDRIAEEYALTVIDATRSILSQQTGIRRIVERQLESYRPQPMLGVEGQP